MSQMSEFLARYENPSLAISTVVDTESQRIINSNHKVIESLLKIMMLCGKQGLALRGHGDDSIWWNDQDKDATSNEGNFVASVQFRAETDLVLGQHLAKAPQNAHYTSKTVKNEMVKVIGTSIHNDILIEVNKAKFYSVIADEVTDIANKEELSLSLCYTVRTWWCHVWSVRGLCRGWKNNWWNIGTNHPGMIRKSWIASNISVRSVLWQCVEYIWC